MENASKALLIAASALIGLMVLSIAIYLTTSFGEYSAEVHKEVENNQLAQFNNQFTIYNGRKDLTIYDIITAANLANDNNEKNGIDASEKEKENSLYIYVSAMIGDESIDSFDKFQKLQNNDGDKLSKELQNGELKKYTCKVSISSITGRVYKVVFRPTSTT